jgi:enamine deaminase RidA (YjgF/YER057c/UK114 family)
MKRQNISSGTKWEALAGYSRAIRIGERVHVSGTTATDEAGDLVGAGSAYAQTAYIIEKIGRALAEAGADLSGVYRTRIYVTDVSKWEEVARAHAEFFDEIRPANTLIEVSGLVGEGYLVEMEADAVIMEASS